MYRAGLVTTLALASIRQSCAWGSDGHKTVARIASSLVRSETKNAISSILGAQSMSDVATWADEVRHTSGWEWSAPLHFVNTPDQACDYEYQRDCRDDGGVLGNCVVGAINNYTQQLGAGASVPRIVLPLLRGAGSADEQLVALKFVIHFVGDVHQPLHCGFKDDLGGNTIDVTFQGKSTNLHSVWDNYLVWQGELEATGSGYDWEGYAANLTGRIRQGDFQGAAQQWATCSDGSANCPGEWASESVHDACQYAYATVQKDEDIPDSYVQTRVPVVNRRIAQAGVRLAAVLDGIFA